MTLLGFILTAFGAVAAWVAITIWILSLVVKHQKEQRAKYLRERGL